MGLLIDPVSVLLVVFIGPFVDSSVFSDHLADPMHLIALPLPNINPSILKQILSSTYRNTIKIYSKTKNPRGQEKA